MKIIFKLAHNIQNDTELRLAKEELEQLTLRRAEPVKNLVDLMIEEPLRNFVSQDDVRPQDFMTRLPYCGSLQAYAVESDKVDLKSLLANLTYFREFYINIDRANENTIQEVLAGFNLPKIAFLERIQHYENIAPFIDLFTTARPDSSALIRILTLHTIYEVSDFIFRLSWRTSKMDEMMNESIRHLKLEMNRPFSPSSARWHKRISDFADSREAPQLYLTHFVFGIHGKFFPRMIGALLNAIKLGSNSTVLDPFCGSGTMNVEAAIRGIRNLGVDMQPLFVLISRLKTSALSWDSPWLEERIKTLLDDVNRNCESLYERGSILNFFGPVAKSQIVIPKTLMKGYDERSLECLERIKACIESLEDDQHQESLQDLRDFCKLPIAYWMRSMLKKQSPEKIVETYSEYLLKIGFSVRYTQKFNSDIYRLPIGKSHIYEGDVRRLSDIDEPLFQRELIDGIVTSPPYGTAIDYIGDHAWALYGLDLAKDHLKLDKEGHIGSARINVNDVKRILCDSDVSEKIPIRARDIVNKMNLGGRESKAASYMRYFVDMCSAFDEMARVLKRGSHLVMVIGAKQELRLEPKGTLEIPLGQIMEDLGMETGKLDIVNTMDIGLQKASELGAIPTEHIIFFKKK